jgi:16S rRNA (cytosine1402-N4)-methyltransferase
MLEEKNQNKNKQHEPVLLNEVLQYLDPKAGESYLDLTAGYGGHAKAILDRTGSLTTAVLVDRDINAINELTKSLGSTVNLMHQDFYKASVALKEEGRKFDLILADLGVSSPHLNEGKRGFSINTNGPLDMRMDQSQELTAEHIVNKYKQVDIERILKTFGEEPKAKQISKLIVNARPINTTKELAQVAAKAWPGHSRVHPATRTFQAIRIAVNDELLLLTSSLQIWFSLLNPGGRIAIISFHSLEDRLVKNSLKQFSGEKYDSTLTLLTKHPVVASPQEIVNNPRARSAKLRAAVKIKKKGN